MDNNDAVKETISNLKAVRNNFWTAILILVGSSLTLALNADNIIKYLLSLVGVIASIIFIALYRSVNNDINSHIKKLEKN